MNWSQPIPLWFYILNNIGFISLVAIMWKDLIKRHKK